MAETPLERTVTGNLLREVSTKANKNRGCKAANSDFMDGIHKQLKEAQGAREREREAGSLIINYTKRHKLHLKRIPAICQTKSAFVLEWDKGIILVFLKSDLLQIGISFSLIFSKRY